MATDTEIKKVITVDLGNTTTSLKEYKKHIDELRGSLLQLDETSEEYQKIAQEVTDEQNKLNEVMKVGKTQTDAAEGSYNQLAQTMAELKKQWKATADETERAELGQKILDINNQLKDLDASTGNYQRNVGDYANAFEKAFDKCLDGITSIDGPLGELGGNVKNMLPVIKSINATAISGLNGIKKGIAATGIGVLVIAVSTLIQHWEDFTKIIGVSTTSINEFKQKSLDTLESIIIGAVGVGNAIGNFLLAPIRTTIEAFKGLGNVVKSVFSGNFSQAAEDAKNAIASIGDVWNKAIDFSESYETGKTIGQTLIDRLRSLDSSPEVEEAAEDAGKKTAKTIGKGIEKGIKESSKDTVKPISDIMTDIFKTALDDAIKNINEEAKRRSDWLKNAIQEAVDEASQEEFDLQYKSGIEDPEEQAEREYEIERNLIERKIDLQKTYIENFIGTQEEKEAELKRLAKLEQDLDNMTVKHNHDSEQKKKKDAQTAAMASLDTLGMVFGTMKDMYDENSKEYKALAIAETTISTLTGAIDAYKSMSGIPYVGPVLGAIAAAAVTAAGIANIAKIKSTNTSGSGSSSIAAPATPQMSATTVTPLLDETADLNRLEESGVTGDSGKEQQNMRVYVVDQDIRDANHRAQVVEDNATF